jgi:hypothetical protein
MTFRTGEDKDDSRATSRAKPTVDEKDDSQSKMTIEEKDDAQK